MGETKCSHDIKINAFIVIKFTIIRFSFGVETSRINWAYDSSRPYKYGKIPTCFLSQLNTKQLYFTFLSIFRGDNEKPDDSLEKVTMNCLRFYNAICRKDRTR